MASITLGTRSGLEHLIVAGRVGSPDGEAGVTLALHENAAVVCVMARRARIAALTQRVKSAFGIDLPTLPRRHAAGHAVFAWAGPGRWLAVADGIAGHAFERQLRTELSGLASVCDQTDLHTLIRVSGARAPDALAKGIMIDLHLRAFGAGDVAATLFGHIPVHLWQIDAAPRYVIAVSRSLAADLWHGLVEAAREYGVTIEPSVV